MNIYEKMQTVKAELLSKNLKKSGNNKFAGYNYYELADFLPVIIQLCNTHGLFTSVSFTDIAAELLIVNSENPEEQMRVTSPMRQLELKGCNQIQALGGVETYSRRYLYMAAFDIVESDMFDGADPRKPTEQNDKPAREIMCEDCGLPITPYNGKTSTQIAEGSMKMFSRQLCARCSMAASKKEDAPNDNI